MRIGSGLPGLCLTGTASGDIRASFPAEPVGQLVSHIVHSCDLERSRAFTFGEDDAKTNRSVDNICYDSRLCPPRRGAASKEVPNDRVSIVRIPSVSLRSFELQRRWVSARVARARLC